LEAQHENGVTNINVVFIVGGVENFKHVIYVMIVYIMLQPYIGFVIKCGVQGPIKPKEYVWVPTSK
jgi:hypothetical protein